MESTVLNTTAFDFLDEIDDGTNPLEVYSITLFIPVCSLLLSLCMLWSNLSWKYATLIETISINLVLLLALTSFCDHLLTFLLSLIILLLTVFFCIYIQTSKIHFQHLKNYITKSQALEDFNLKFIGDYRGHLLLATSVCILAVDFAFFPVRFSKTETYGWSVMDAGVGSFVFLQGLCSSHARNPTLQQNSFKQCILSSLPLFLLGVVRLVATTAVGYHKVVPEYGIHWNFFFTISLTKVICYFLSSGFHFIQPGILALVIVIFHQTLLSSYLTAYILSDSRANFVEANKEGICSLLGFVAIYFSGVQQGRVLWRKRDKVKDFIYLFLILMAVGMYGWIIMYVIHGNIEPVSRRMANAAYCIWVVTLTSLQIALHLAHQIINFLLGEVFQKDVSDCLLWNAINYNALFFFLSANVFTGLVNLAIKTENYDAWTAFLILAAYLTVLNVSVVIPYKKRIRLKFW